MTQEQFDNLMKLIDDYGDCSEACGDFQTSGNAAAVRESRAAIVDYIRSNLMKGASNGK